MFLSNHIKSNCDKIKKAKEIVENFDAEFINHKTINPKTLDNQTITIVMTTYNRPKQTHFTLKKISESEYKNIQIIIVDDYIEEQYSIEDLEKYNLHIDYVRISNKFWVNPCVNYNIGFKLIKGGKIIIQNAEVCHVGDVIDFINKNLKDNEYYVFDVLSISSLENNEILYKEKLTYDKIPEITKYCNGWFQHTSYSNRNFHFLTAITANTFKLIEGFDYDFCVGTSWDDNEFVFRIKKNNIPIKNIKNDVSQIMGIHQWHAPTPSTYHSQGKFDNQPLLQLKQSYYELNKKFLDLSVIDYNIDILKIK